MKLVPVFLLFYLGYSSNLLAQVDDPAFNVLLNTFLSHSVKEITVKELASQTNSGILLDAREKEEYQVSHLKDAKHVGYNNFEMKSVKDIPLDQSIVVYCAVGYRSEKIAEKLVKAGIKMSPIFMAASLNG
jgi:rhodanese-related sulfurtransferase